MIVPLLLSEELVEPCEEPFETSHEPHDFSFRLENDELTWNGVPIMALIEQYGTPSKFTYLPKISRHLQYAKSIFKKAMEHHNYQANHFYCYCTKSSHFRFVLDEVLKNNNTHLEISSAFDVPIIEELFYNGQVDHTTHIICNGYKPPEYTQKIRELLKAGLNVIPIVDSLREIDAYEHMRIGTIDIGIRVATDESQDLPFRTSRLGVRYSEVCNLYRTRIQHSRKIRLKMLHFHINSGIEDTKPYWSELSCFIHKYCKLRKICPGLDSIDIGGGLPIAQSLDFSYDYANIADQIIGIISRICGANSIPVPHLFTEFGKYTVGESGAAVYQVVEQKQQNAREMWHMINGSFVTQLPDTTTSRQKCICMPINNWNASRQNVLLGGLTCDPLDFYAASPDSPHVSMPRFDEFLEDQYVGFFHTGAYQENLGGYGGVSHCLIPAPKHVIVDRDEHGRWKSWLFAPEQGSEGMMKLLGYGTSETTSQEDDNKVACF